MLSTMSGDDHQALHVLGYNSAGKYVTFEPLGLGGDLYLANVRQAEPRQIGRIRSGQRSLLP